MTTVPVPGTYKLLRGSRLKNAPTIVVSKVTPISEVPDAPQADKYEGWFYIAFRYVPERTWDLPIEEQADKFWFILPEHLEAVK